MVGGSIGLCSNRATLRGQGCSGSVKIKQEMLRNCFLKRSSTVHQDTGAEFHTHVYRHTLYMYIYM